jgi:hypothetical protein
MRLNGFTHARFVLCEGNEDAALVRALAASVPRNIKSLNVSPVNDLCRKQGKDGFEDAIIGSDALTGFDGVNSVVIISDNDDDPNKSFSAVRAKLKKAIDDASVQRQWALPDAPEILVAGSPSVSIWMWPSANRPGCLETVLWDIIQRKYPEKAKCVEAAIGCAGADLWSISKRDKAKVRCFMSLAAKKNPAMTLSHAWRDNKELFPVDSIEFTPIAQFLSALP